MTVVPTLMKVEELSVTVAPTDIIDAIEDSSTITLDDPITVVMVVTI